MTKRLCKCGAIVSGRCPKCSPAQTHARTTGERGYDYAWKQLRARKVAHNPLCERCLTLDRVRAVEEVHHIVAIRDAPELRLAWSNLMSVCHDCHQELEPQEYGRWKPCAV